MIIKFPNFGCIAVVYQHTSYGTPDFLRMAWHNVKEEIVRAGITIEIAKQKEIITSNKCRIIFIDNAKEEQQMRGYAFDAVYYNFE